MKSGSTTAAWKPKGSSGCRASTWDRRPPQMEARGVESARGAEARAARQAQQEEVEHERRRRERAAA